MVEYKDSRIVPWPRNPFPMELNDIGEVEGISSERVRKILVVAIEKLKKNRYLRKVT